MKFLVTLLLKFYVYDMQVLCYACEGAGCCHCNGNGCFSGLVGGILNTRYQNAYIFRFYRFWRDKILCRYPEHTDGKYWPKV